MKGIIKDLSNLTFNNWKVLNEYKKIPTTSGQKKTHWMCRCICGKEMFVYSNSLISGKSKSCGCVRPNRREFGKACLTNLYSSYRSKAKRKKIEFKITEQEFQILTKNNCFYCGKEPKNNHVNKKMNGNYIYNGLDRVNNKLGYIKENLVSCCKNCNKAKLDLTLEEFFGMIKIIYERNNLNEK
jgi:5-methylcytosine-specific restriction endonuclease McrA